MSNSFNLINALNNSLEEEFKAKRKKLQESSLNEDTEFDYQLLDRLKQDCEYFLGNGNGFEKHLWAGSVEDQIAKMKELYNKLKEKPEWLTMEDIENYEKEMLAKRDNKVNESSSEDSEYNEPEEQYPPIHKRIVVSQEDQDKMADRYNLAQEIYDYYSSDMGNYFDEIQGNEEETFNEILTVLGDKDEAMINRFIEDIDDEEIVKELQKLLDNNVNEEEQEINDLQEAQEYVVTYIADKTQNKTASISVQANSKVDAAQKARQSTVGDSAIVSIQALNEAYKARHKLQEEDVVNVPIVDVELDYIINDVTVLDNVSNGDVQSPDIESLITLVDESLKADYSNDWGKINILSSRIDENSSFALVDISSKEVLEQFKESGIQDIAIGKNLILEKVGNLLEFKVNNLNGTTKYCKKTTNPVKTIREWIESEFLNEAKQEKEKEAEILKAKTEKETVENYIQNRLDLKAELENIKMFIELSKQVKAEEDMKESIQNRMYSFAAEMPNNIEVSNSEDKYELKFNSYDDIVEIVFGKDWVKENDIPEVVKPLKESYEQFNIGNIEVVFNPDTYECLYSIPTADVKDKKINLAEVPTVDTPYDTNTIIKNYVETKFGKIPSADQEEPAQDKEDLPQEQPTEPQEEPSQEEPKVEIDKTTEITTNPEETPVDDEPIHEDELPEEPGEEDRQEQPAQPQEEVPDEETQESQAETGNAVFMKIRPNQHSNIENIRTRALDGDTPQSSYIVVDEISLSNEEWDDLNKDFSQPKSFLTNIKPIDRKNYSFNVVKVTAPGAGYDLLIDPLGYDYSRYIAVENN